ncbi:MAG TPA: O-acetyl-ADP-ribose deacetylase [Thermohalobaculum sp.]|nr:O-acetyl-ADP-ribose deacetylase [Thermohalobaculum sp.]
MTHRIVIHQGDITALAVDAIVNAANTLLTHGGGVCGAIHRASGPELGRECAGLGGCATGNAKITKGYSLPARHVIHTVGPIWLGGDSGEAKLLAACYRGALKITQKNTLATIAFPAISTGIFGYPPDEAAKIAVSTVAKTLPRTSGITQVIFCCFDAASAERHQNALAALEG